MKDNELDDFFKESLKDEEITPNNLLWERIEQQLDEQKIIPIKRASKKWQGYSIAASIALILGISVMFYQSQQELSLENNAQILTEEKNSKVPSEITEESLQTPTELPKKVPSPQSLLANVTSAKVSRSPTRDANHSQAREARSKEEQHIDYQENNYTETAIKQKKLAPPIALEVSIPRHLVMTDMEPSTQSMVLSEYPEMSTPRSAPRANLFTKVLNAVASTIDIAPDKNLRFSNDEEGTLRINLVSTYTIHTN